MDKWAGEASPGAHYLDLRTARGPVRDWLARPQPFGGAADTFQTEPSRAYDLLVYYPEVTPVCPAAPN